VLTCFGKNRCANW